MNRLVELFRDDPTLITEGKSIDLNLYKKDVIYLIEQSQTLDEIVEKFEKVREAQKKYFKTRDKAVLRRSKQLEAEIDRIIAGLRPNLFNQ